MGILFKYEPVVDSESPESAQFSVDDSRATVVYDVDLSKTPPEVRWADIAGTILGYPTYDPSSPTMSNLTRGVPWQHPQAPQLWATSISNLRGRKPNARKLDPVSSYPFVGYQILRFNVLYTVPPYRVLSDSQANTAADLSHFALNPVEFYRYVDYGFEANVEALTRKGNSYFWASVPPAGLPPGVAPNQTLDIGITRRVIKEYLTWTWRHVPEVGLFGATGFGQPFNILNGLGKLNAFQFPNRDPALATSNYAPGTLLFLGAKFSTEAAPVPNNFLGGNPIYPPRTWKVEMRTGFFDPPVNPNWGGAGVPYPHRGWNLLPPPPPAGGPYWYLATLSGLDDVTTAIYPDIYDFTKLFTLMT